MPKKVRPGRSFNFPRRSSTVSLNSRVLRLTRPDDINGDKRLLTAQVRNDTGDNLPAYSIVVLEEVIPTVPANATNARSQGSSLSRFCRLPSQPARFEEMTRVAILQEAIPDSAVGETVLFGRHPSRFFRETPITFIRTIADTTTHFASCYRPGIPDDGRCCRR